MTTTAPVKNEELREREQLSKANKKFGRMHTWRTFIASGFPACAILCVWLFGDPPSRTEVMILVTWATTFFMIGWLEIRLKVVQNKLAMMHDELNDLSGRDPHNGRHGYSISERSDW
ncbi:MAG: hypothetical protein C0480_02930 [Bradyrhizobium sp.]|nr:hypothetical protein [Bradyrhizobium sp.]